MKAWLATILLIGLHLASVQAQAYFCVLGDCDEGVGIFRYRGGTIYIGEFHRGARHGTGQCLYPDGSKYVGAWQNDRPHGRGIWFSATDHLRANRWELGRPAEALSFDSLELAPASMRLAGHAVCLSGDCREGEGVLLRRDGVLYLGPFRQGKAQGLGRAEYPSGGRYRGDWQDDRRHGPGLFLGPDGSRAKGCWEDGRLTDTPCRVVEQLPDLVDTPFVLPVAGCIQGDCSEGQGVYLFRDGARYAGSFQGGKPHGQGELVRPEGDRYVGSFKEGAYEGFGTLFAADGSVREGQWAAGVLVRPVHEPLDGLYDPSPAASSNAPQPHQIRLWAVIIGVAAYDHMPALRYTDDDAYRLYAFLKSPEGGALDDEHLKLLVDEQATRANILRTLGSISSKIGPHDLLLFYFSGHGIPGAFLPYDYDGQPGHTVLHSEVNTLLQQCQARYKLCIADACHSGSLFNAKGGADPESLWDTFYEKLASAHPGTALMLSSKGSETSLESEGLRQGVFSHYLIRGLKGEADDNGDRLISLRELFAFVHYRVRQYTQRRQSPVIRGNFDPDMVVGVSLR